MNRTTVLVAKLIAVALVLASTVSAVSEPIAPPNEDGKAALLKPADKPLDQRIKAEKVTETDLPPLPERVVMPMPADHRISERPEQVPIDPALWQKAHEAITRGLAFLDSHADPRGGWMRDAQAAPTDQPDRAAPVSLAVSSLIIKAFAQGDRGFAERESVVKALRMIRAAHDSNGSFDQSPIANYVTASVVLALASVGNAHDQDLQKDAIQWLQVNQWDQGEGLGPRQDWFGGAGYGGGGRPDMSNTQMMLDALYEAGLSPDEPAFQRALLFASRTQNLKAANKSDWAAAGANDGGFIYSPANGGESMASDAAGEGRYGEKLIAAGQPRSLRSYGSMTYAGFKSMLYAGLSQDDVRVKAAFDWVRHHWTFDENPGLGQQGLYYYYHTMSRALRIAQQDEFADAKGEKHNWRTELIDALLTRQHEDGSWVNQADRWMEGNPALVTAYAVLALEEAMKPVR